LGDPPQPEVLDTTSDDSLSDVAIGHRVIEPLTIKRMPRLVEIYHVSGAELDRLASAHSSLHLTFLGIVVGACVTLLITFFTVQLTALQHATVVALIASSVILTVYFAIRARVDFREQAEQITEIKRNRSAED
jgi:hypothetical protein